MNSNWNYGPETVKWGHDFCDLDLWPWPFAWTSRLSLIMTPENFMMIRWWEPREKGVTDGQTDRQTKRSVLRAVWSQQKIVTCHLITYSSSHWSILFHKGKTKKSEPLTKMWAMMWLLSAQTSRSMCFTHIRICSIKSGTKLIIYSLTATL